MVEGRACPRLSCGRGDPALHGLFMNGSRLC